MNSIQNRQLQIYHYLLIIHSSQCIDGASVDLRLITVISLSVGMLIPVKNWLPSDSLSQRTNYTHPAGWTQISRFLIPVANLSKLKTQVTIFS